MGANDAGEQLEAAKEEIVRLEHEISRLRGLPVHDVPEETHIPDGTSLVSDFTVHAAMVQPLDDTAPAIPAVQLMVATMRPNDAAQTRVISTLLLEERAAHRIYHGIGNCLMLLDNIANNQERPNV